MNIHEVITVMATCTRSRLSCSLGQFLFGARFLVQRWFDNALSSVLVFVVGLLLILVLVFCVCSIKRFNIRFNIGIIVLLEDLT